MSKSTSKQISPKEQVSNIVGSIPKFSEIIQEKHQDFLHTKHKDLKDADLEEYEIVKKYIEDLKPLVCASKLKKEIIEFLEDQALKIDRGAEVSDEIMESMLDNYTLKLSEYTNIVTSQIENGYFDEDDKLDILTILKKTLSPEYEAKYGYSLLHMAAFYNRIAMFKSIFNFGKILDEKFDLKEFDVIDKKFFIYSYPSEKSSQVESPTLS